MNKQFFLIILFFKFFFTSGKILIHFLQVFVTGLPFTLHVGLYKAPTHNSTISIMFLVRTLGL